MQTRTFYSHLSIIFRLKKSQYTSKITQLRPLNSAFCSFIPSLFLSQPIILQNKSNAFTPSVSFFSITKQTQKRSNIDKKHLLFAYFYHSKDSFHLSTNLNKCKPILTPYRTNIIYKKQQGNYFFVYLYYHYALN